MDGMSISGVNRMFRKLTLWGDLEYVRMNFRASGSRIWSGARR